MKKITTTPTLQDWLDWARNTAPPIHADVIAYVQATPQVFDKFPPRTFGALSEAICAMENLAKQPINLSHEDVEAFLGWWGEALGEVK